MNLHGDSRGSARDGVSVPGPPRGRRRAATGSVRQRIEAVAAAERADGRLAAWGSMLGLLRDVILLVKDLAADPRISRGKRWTPAGLAFAYLASPVDLVPDWIPGLGALDDVVVLVWAARKMLGEAGYDIIYEHWRGTDEGLAVVLAVAGVQD